MPLYNKKLIEEEIVLKCKLLNERDDDIRTIERITSHRRDAVMRAAKGLAVYYNIFP